MPQELQKLWMSRTATIVLFLAAVGCAETHGRAREQDPCVRDEDCVCPLVCAPVTDAPACSNPTGSLCGLGYTGHTRSPTCTDVYPMEDPNSHLGCSDCCNDAGADGGR
jgi:hypothetical protein